MKLLPMKNILGLTVILLACSLPSRADTNSFLSGPLPDAVGGILTATNLAIAPYGIYDTHGHTFGGGLLALYNITPAVATGAALQYLNHEVWMPSAQLQLQAPVRLGNTVELVPLIFTGIGTPVSGKGPNNGSAIGIFGGGLGVKLFGSEIHSRLDVFLGAAKWTGFPGEQLYGGLLWRF